jgi:hypothetical protein
LGDEHLKCGRIVLADAVTGSLSVLHQTLLGQHLDRIELLDRQVEELNRFCAAHIQEHQNAVVRLIAVPGIGAEAAQEIFAEIDRRRARSHRQPNWHPGSVFVRVPMRALPKTGPVAPPRVTASCGACCARPRRRRFGPKAVTCSPSSNDLSCA